MSKPRKSLFDVPNFGLPYLGVYAAGLSYSTLVNITDKVRMPLTPIYFMQAHLERELFDA